jgi:hypothetical protein
VVKGKCGCELFGRGSKLTGENRVLDWNRFRGLRKKDEQS